MRVKLRMVDDASYKITKSKITKSIFPFSTLSADRKEPFSEKRRRAAIFCLAELERKRGRGLVTRQSQEELAYLAEIGYPFWMCNLDQISLLFDGLNTTSHTLTYLCLPDTQVFLDNIARSSKQRQTYTTFLADHINYFQAPDIEERKGISGLVTDAEFLNAFISYLSEVKPITTSLSDTILISPTIDESSFFSLTQELRKLKAKFIDDVDALYACMKHLDKKTVDFVKGIRIEIEEVTKKFDKEIQTFKASTKKMVKKIHQRYDESVMLLSKKAEEDVLNLYQDKIKVEKIIEQLINDIKRCGEETKTAAINRDSLREQKWRAERDKLEKKLSETEKEAKTKLGDFDKRINDVEYQKKLKIFELKSDGDARIKDATKDLVEILSSRDARNEIYELEMEKLEELTSSIVQQIDKLAKLRESSVVEFNKLGFQQEREKFELVYMPFYLACYKFESRKRYVLFPPSIVNRVSFSVKIKGTFGETKIKHLLQPRSDKIVSLLNEVLIAMEQNAVFDREMNEACARVDIIQTKNRKSIKNGLKILKEEGWFSEKEFASFNQRLKSTIQNSNTPTVSR